MVLIGVALLASAGCAGDSTGAATSGGPSSTATVGPPPGVTEETVTINDGTPWQLEGTLSIPDGAGPFPAALLVAGSGPSDRDETTGGNKPLKDVADSLASQGIVVLRYDKRASTYGTQMAGDGSVTVEEDYVQDAVAAADLLRADARVDPGRVFVVGHSEGGMLAPRIDAEGGDFAGIVIMAGSPRGMLDVLADQLTAAVPTLPESQRAGVQQQIDAIVAVVPTIASMPDDEAKQGWIYGASLYYFKEMDAHPAADYLLATSKPVLIVQGSKDLNVSVDKDYGAYQTLLAGRSNVTFKLYDGLNHLFMAATTDILSTQYDVPDHVDPTVLTDLGSWIKSS